MWSGGCTSHNTSNGEATYCLDGNDFNSAGKYININSNGIVTVTIPGYYRINVYIDGTSCSYRRVYLRRNYKASPGWTDFANSHHYENSGGWYQLIVDQTWPFKEGDQFQVISQQDCGDGYYKWHSWNPYGQHSRAQFSIEGPLAN